MTTTEAPDLDSEHPADIGRVEWKALPSEETTSPLTGVIGFDDEEGTITAIVAVSGVPDKVGDVIVPGSMGTAIKRLKPKGVADHNWGAKTSKMVYGAELMPGDPRLPKTTPDGQPWPDNAGGLLIKAKYNLDKQLGRDAYADAKFYGPEECFSIGYKVRPGGARVRRGLRYLHDFDIYEFSQVLHGAHDLATLTGVKSLVDRADWYSDGRSGSTPIEGTLEVKAIGGRRVVRNAQFWGLPIGTPIKAGMKPHGRAHAATDAEIAATTTPEAGHPGQPTGAAPAGPAQGVTGAAPQPIRPGVPAALTALHQRYQDFAAQQHDQSNQHAGIVAITSMNMLAQFAAPGADVHASPDGSFAAVNNGKAWVIVDTINASTLPPAPPNVSADQIDEALSQIADLGIPWSNIAARRKRWEDPKAKAADRAAVEGILSKLTPFDTHGADAQQARYDAEGAISEGDRDGLADALVRMGLPPDQDPHDTAATLLVLPSEVVTQRLDAIATAATDPHATPQVPDAASLAAPTAPDQPPAYVPTGNMGTPHALSDDELEAEHAHAAAKLRAAHEAGIPRNTTAYSDHKLAEQVFGDEKRKRAARKAEDDKLGLTQADDGQLEVTEEVAARQDRVQALLDAGDKDLKGKSDDELGSARKDLVAELELQTALAKRDKAKPATSALGESDAPAAGGGEGGASVDAGAPAEDTPPKQRPGLGGAAEDLGDALNATPRDDATVKAAADRLAKLLAKTPTDSKAFKDVHTAIGDGDIHAAIESGALKPGMLFAAAAALREERRTARNEGARKRRVAKRIERDRIRSMIGSVDTELRSRGVNPQDYGGAVDGVPEAKPTAIGETPGSSASTTAPTKTSQRSTVKPPDEPDWHDLDDNALAKAVRVRIRMLDRLVNSAGPDDKRITPLVADIHAMQGELNRRRENPPDSSDDLPAGGIPEPKGLVEQADIVSPNPEDVPPGARIQVWSGPISDGRRSPQYQGWSSGPGPNNTLLVRNVEGTVTPYRVGSYSLLGDDHEPTRGAGAAVVPAVPAAGIRGDHRQGDVLRDTGGAGGAGDRAGSGRTGGGRPAGGDVRGESEPTGSRQAGGDRAGDAPDATGAAAPELAGQRLPAAGDTGPEPGPGDTGRPRSGADRGDTGVRRGEQRTGPAETGQPAGADADTSAAAGLPERRDEQSGQPEQPDGNVDHPVTTEAREAAVPVADDGEPVPAELGTVELPDEQPTIDRAQVDAIPDTGQDFRPVNSGDLAPAGKRAKLAANIAALEVLRTLQAEHRPATKDEQRVLARWAGWGGLPEVFDDAKPDYAADRERLRGLLSDSEWAEARRNTLNAHYTDATAVAAIWKAVQDLGFDGGRVLEPGSGSGTFIGFAPENVDMVGVELDSTTAAISKALYPSATIRNESFADTRLPTGSMDAVVGNVPFGDFALTDRVHNPGRKLSIHNHFIVKSLAATKPGGICALLTSRYTLDSKSPAARKQMAEMGDLLGAVRLPTGSHSKTAGTDVIEDILIFRRREPGAEPRTSQDWVNANVRDINGFPITVNDYFTAHPDQVLGEETAEKGQYGTGSLIIKGNKDEPLDDDLAAALGRISDEAREHDNLASPQLEAPAVIVEGANAHDGHIGVDPDGGFVQVVGGAEVPFDVPAKQAEELRGLIGLRDTLRELLAAESVSVTNSTEIRTLRKALNDQYDAYVARYGPINRYSLSKTGARVTPGQGGFRRDPMSAIVRALEAYDPETGTGTKTSIFTKRAVAPREIPTHADNPTDALALSMDTYGEVNLKAIADMLGTDTDTARERLGELVFEQPPLTVAEQNAAWTDHLESTGLLADREIHVNQIDLSTVGESVRQQGQLEPAAAYLSGNVRRKLAAAKAAAEHDPRFAANVAALENVIPRDLGVDEVDGRLGAAWIPADDVKQFLVDLLHDGDDSYGAIKVATSGGGIWEVEGGDWGQRATEQWGTDRVSAGEIVKALLEQRSIRVTDTIDGKSYPNLEATTAAQAKAEEISERFSEWLWEDSERTRRLLANYNNQFNAIVLRSYDDVPRTFPGMAESFKPREHQVAAVNRMVSEPCALLAHVVGAGKTAEMAMGTAELKRLGLARKPAIVVPNHMLEQFSREYLQIYPNAKILAAGTDDLKGDKRREFVARAATGEWDCVILTQNAMQMIPVSREAMNAYIDRELATMRAQLEAAKSSAEGDGDKAKANTVKRMEKAVVKAEEALKAKLDKNKDAGVTFEQTGIDYVCVDEAHMYSNLRTLSNIQGAGATGSDMASDLHMKLEHLRANSASGRVATFATGTPIRNSITQAYIMQRYMRPDLLEEAGIHSFDQWAATFGQTIDEMELKPEGAGFRLTTRFAKFRNVPELLRLFHVFADVKMADDLNLPTPKLATGAVQNVVVPGSPALKAFIADLGRRADLVRGNAPEKRTSVTTGEAIDDNMLLISGDGRKAALSMKLIGQEHTDGKIEAAAGKIADIWAATKDRPVPCDINDPTGGDCPPPGSMQIVFCDMGTPGAKKSTKEDAEKTVSGGDYDAPNVDIGNWNAYETLKEQLVARGMDPSTIRFMHEAKNDREKAELFAAARNGQVSVLIGSTEKMGVGTNVQRRAVALHHLDAPWRPSDVEQRDGRIMRQGNTNDEIAIYRYVTEGSFDAYMWQTLERKKKFIDQIMRGKLGDVRELEDVGDTALSYAEVKALATGNPMLMDKARVDTTVSKLARLERQHARTQTNLGRDIDAYEANAAQADRDGNVYSEAIAKRTDTAGAKFSLNVNGQKLTDRGAAADALKQAINSAIYNYSPYRDRGVPKYLATFGGHDLMGAVETYFDKIGARRYGIVLSWDGLPGSIERLTHDRIDTLGPGVLVTLRNNLDGFESRRDIQRDRAKMLRDEVAVMRPRVGLPFAKADELTAARAESARLEAAMTAAGLDANAEPAESQVAAGLANARQLAATRAANMGRSQSGPARDALKRLANSAASPNAKASADGTLATLGDGDDLKVIMTRDGVNTRPPGLTGAIDDPQALVDDLAALDIPWGEGTHSLNNRWSEYAIPYTHDYSLSFEQRQAKREAEQAAVRQRAAADKAAIKAVWERHLVANQTKSMVIPTTVLDRARALGLEVKADTAVTDAPDADEESYQEIVDRDDRYVMATDGQLLRAVECPSCGNTTSYPVGAGPEVRTCLMCGGKLQMQPTPATVAG